MTDKAIEEMAKAIRDAYMRHMPTMDGDSCFEFDAAKDAHAAYESTSAARIERLEGALTPSEETKAAYMGEFSVPLPDVDEDGNEYIRQINVPWVTIKAIMSAIRSRAALKGETE